MFVCLFFSLHFQAGGFGEGDDEVGEELPMDEEEVASDEDDDDADNTGGAGGRPYK